MWDNEILAIHVTEKCNLYCNYCYLKKKRSKQDIDFDYIKLAAEKIEPETLFFYGGEPLLRRDIISRTVQTYGDSFQYILETNGLLLDKRFMDFLIQKNFGIVISLDGFSFRENNQSRNLSKEQFEKLVGLLHKYKDYPKLEIMVSISKDTDNILLEPDFNYEFYLIVDEERCEINQTKFKNARIPEKVVRCMTEVNVPNIMPKLRLHVSGHVSRTLIDHPEYRISHINDWKQGYEKLGKLSYPKTCERCFAFDYCALLHTFAYWAFELDKKGLLHTSFACLASYVFWTLNDDFI